MRRNLSLLELNRMVREAIEDYLPDRYWVEAEVSEAREVGGHCYMELIQKTERGNTPVAKAMAKCWRSTWSLAGPQFMRVTGRRLSAGMKVLLEVEAQFHENYGFSWIVTDIDPTFTVGDMARKRQEIINALKQEGVFDLNKELPLSPFCQRIAVISSAGAAGYGDFYNQLTDNAFGLKFEVTLFPATMQGDGVEQSVISALNMIDSAEEGYHCVVIIRGGGATSDLSGFDTLLLAENVANFPLPVITGIGHDRDESVLDMISHTHVKTPTAAAAFLIDNLADTLHFIEQSAERITASVARRLDREKLRLQQMASRIPLSATKTISSGRARLDVVENGLRPMLQRVIDRHRHRLDLLEQKAVSLDPELPLRRGYTITLVGGKAVRDASQVSKGDVLETRTANGTILSEVLTK